MRQHRVLAIGLDGMEPTFAEHLMAAGEMPALAGLRKRSACFRLDHGPAQRTGLAWEHFASGLSPDAARRWAAVEFEPATYRAWQEGARFVPWWSSLDLRVVVFDTPYVDFRRAPGTQGIVAWGAHDPGTVMAARPAALQREFLARFGGYPSAWTYATPWPSAARSQMMGKVLGQALETRARAARWLAYERLPDWDLFVVVAGEPHGSTEGLWHGVSPDHPLHDHASAPAARAALVEVHRALDRMVDELVRSAGEAAVVAFTMGGMGSNHSDVQSMVLLPELLYRHAFGRSLLTVPAAWQESPGHVPILGEDDDWVALGRTWVPERSRTNSGTMAPAIRSFVKKWPALYAGARGARAAMRSWRAAGAATAILDVDWQPAARYREHWPAMRAFALPSYYDGRIRINVRGRERHGLVDAAQYQDVCDEIEQLVRECRNPRTGDSAVAFVERAGGGDPFRVSTSEPDLCVVWRDVATALEHPRLGVIGPVPLRRTGGHTGPYGVAYVAAPGVPAGDLGVRSSFDVAPTLVEILGHQRLPCLSGACMLAVR
jgi:predicted AlkP superfamily phosphohydrolase/phosphomutase